MGRKNNPQFAVGAYWMSKSFSLSGKSLHGISLWKIVEKQSKGLRILAKMEQLQKGRISYMGNAGLKKQITCADLLKYKAWTYVENVDAVRILYGV